MQTQWNEAELVALRNMIACCRQIQELLVVDQTAFSQHNFRSLEDSNKKKVDLLEKLNFLVENMNHNFLPNQQSSFMKRIEHDISSLSTEKQKEIRSIIKELQLELGKCYNSIIKNIDIAFSSIKQFKEIWDKLLANKTKTDLTYDRLGKKV
jgi:hypothetical protein